mmetsp:Transcript_2311/g.5296  ORF Transcript_2311/g.5296 Transcript_2311/m.5296 type:complete len:1371 (+) Transcript_2311:222-4334(+)
MLAGAAAAAAEATARDSAESDMGEAPLCSAMTETSENGGEMDSGTLRGIPNIHKQHHVPGDSSYQYSVAVEADSGVDSVSSMDHHLGVPKKQQVEPEQRFPAAVDDEAERINRPQEHFITIASNGTILGITETATGYPPNSLLMTSVYDSVHEDDLVGLQSVKKHCWERGLPEVEAYVRRRTVEGDWVWLMSKFVSFIDNPVPGVIIHEFLVKDVALAEIVSRTTRIAALITEAVLDSRRDENAASNAVLEGYENAQRKNITAVTIPGVADDAVALQSLLKNTAGDGGADLSCSANRFQYLVNSTATGVQNIENGASDGGINAAKKNQSNLLNDLDYIHAGACIDLSKVSLTAVEVKLLTLVLTGRLQIEDLPNVVLAAMNTPTRSLSSVLDGYSTEMEIRQREVLRYGHASRKRTSRSLCSGQSSRHVRLDSMPSPLSTPVRPKHARQLSLSDSSTSRLDDRLGSSDKMIRGFQALRPPNIAVINLSFANVGSSGVEMLSEIIYAKSGGLRTIDLSFCSLREAGILALCRAFRKRKKCGLPSLQGILLSGNYISYKAAKELGQALSMTPEKRVVKRRHVHREMTGNDEDGGGGGGGGGEEDEDNLFGGVGGRRIQGNSDKQLDSKQCAPSEIHKGPTDAGLQLLHLGCTSITSEALNQILLGLGQDCPIRELSIPSNRIGSSGATLLVAFLEGKGTLKCKRDRPVMPNLDRLDLSNNELGNDGTAKLTRAISKRVKVNIFDLRLSTNSIGAGGIETIMNKLLQHNLVRLSLDNNTIGDRGCQLVAASLPSMHHLSRLNLSFNQIGSRGVTTLMRALVGSESITYLGLSGNVLKISGAIATGFALAQHPRLAELELDNCCLSQVAQCHIAAGVISNRWVPMKRLNGFRVGPPMVAIGALEVLAQHLSNEECFRIRRDIQMKAILQWMESNRAARIAGASNSSGGQPHNFGEDGDDNFLTADIVSCMNDVRGATSQSAYLMLDWLSRIPFDEDELNDLRRYFYDRDGGEGDGIRSSDGNINLKHRGDLLAALSSEIAEEIRCADPVFDGGGDVPVGLSIDPDEFDDDDFPFSFFCGIANNLDRAVSVDSKGKRGKQEADSLKHSESPEGAALASPWENRDTTMNNSSTMSSLSRQSLISGGSARSIVSQGGHTGSSSGLKARITMFPQFAAKLDILKASAQEMMDKEEDPTQQDIIAQQLAEASLTLMRQLRFHCMNQGLDGWRQGRSCRKVLIVDDSMVTRKMVARAFEKANFVVDTAENGMEGVAKLKESIYDIAFMDIDMPVMNGFDATKALREWEDRKRPGARQPICALTAAYVDDFEREELMKFKEAGLDVMESKPCNIPRLFKVVDDVSPMFSDLSISVTQQSCY